MPPSSSSGPSPDHAIDPIAAAAADWLTRREEGLSPAEARAFAQWLRADPRHAAAFDRLEQTHALLERLPFATEHLAGLRAAPSAPTPSPAPVPVAVPAVFRGRRMFLAMAAAAALAALGWWQWPPSNSAPLHFATSAGGYERVLLADGSTLELNAQSAATVHIGARERHVTLTAGEAHFSVAPNPARPFIVSAGTYAVRAVGTAFNVRFAPHAVEVLVTEGRVQVSAVKAPPPVDAPAPAQPLLEAGQRVVIPAGTAPAAGQIERLDAAAVRQALAWQERRLNFVDTPLREVVALFNQRNQTQLVLVNPELGDRPVGGTFALGNAEAFVRLLQSSGDIVAERRGEHEILLRRVR